MKKNLPEIGDLVVVTINEVKNFGAKARLEEYPGVEGYVHVAEVATGWVKHIRDHLREGQRTVCKVINVNESRRNVELSLKRVNEHQKRDKISLWKNDQKAGKLLEIVAKSLSMDPETAWNEFGSNLEKQYGNLYAAFEEASVADPWLPDVNAKWKAAFQKVAGENVSVPYVKVTGFLEAYSLEPDGIERIRKALDSSGMEGLEITYMGAPKYRVTLRDTDYKAAEESLRKGINNITDCAKKNQVIVEFTRE